MKRTGLVRVDCWLQAADYARFVKAAEERAKRLMTSGVRAKGDMLRMLIRTELDRIDAEWKGGGDGK